MARVGIAAVEVYPVFYCEPAQGHSELDVIDVPVTRLKRWRRAARDWHDVQAEMGAMLAAHQAEADHARPSALAEMEERESRLMLAACTSGIGNPSAEVRERLELVDEVRPGVFRASRERRVSWLATKPAPYLRELARSYPDMADEINEAMGVR